MNVEIAMRSSWKSCLKCLSPLRLRPFSWMFVETHGMKVSIKSDSIEHWNIHGNKKNNKIPIICQVNVFISFYWCLLTWISKDVPWIWLYIKWTYLNLSKRSDCQNHCRYKWKHLPTMCTQRVHNGKLHCIELCPFADFKLKSNKTVWLTF